MFGGEGVWTGGEGAEWGVAGGGGTEGEGVVVGDGGAYEKVFEEFGFYVVVMVGLGIGLAGMILVAGTGWMRERFMAFLR